MTLNLIVFIVLALFIGVCSVLAVTTSRILRAATYLLFVLFGTAGIYFHTRHSDRANFAFGDGHAGAMRALEVKKLIEDGGDYEKTYNDIYCFDGNLVKTQIK